MIMKPVLLPVLGAVTTVVLMSMNHASAAETNVCKGLEQHVCENNSDCSYVDSYVRKNGTAVAGHCRYKPGRKKKAAEQTTVTPPPVTAPPVTTTPATAPPTIVPNKK